MCELSSGWVRWPGEFVEVRHGPLASQMHDKHWSTAHVSHKVREEQFGHVLFIDLADELRRQYDMTLLKIKATLCTAHI